MQTTAPTPEALARHRAVMAADGPEALAAIGRPSEHELALVAAYADRIRVDDLDDRQLAAVLGIYPDMAGMARDALTVTR